MNEQFPSYRFPISFCEEKIYLGKNEGCIFCKKPYESSSFNHEAHVVPEFLGNKTLFSRNECNECNAIFSKIERDFAAFIGLDRSLYSINGKKGVPTHCINENQKITSSTQYKIPIITILPSTENVKLDLVKRNSVITSTKDSYYNTNLFKALLKIALSIMPFEKICQYTILTDFVRQDLSKPYPLVKWKNEQGEIHEVKYNELMLIKEIRFLNAPPIKEIEVSLRKPSFSGLDAELENNSYLFVIRFGDVAFQILIPNDLFFIHRIAYPSDFKCSFISPEEFKPKFSMLNVSISTIDCTVHHKIVKEKNIKSLSFQHAVRLDEKILKLDEKGCLTEESLHAAMIKVKMQSLISFSTIIFTMAWKNEDYINIKYL